MDRPGKVANPARGQLNRENEFPVSPYASENLVSRNWFSRPVPACSFSIIGLNLVLTHEISPDFRAASIYLFKPPYDIGPVPS